MGGALTLTGMRRRRVDRAGGACWASTRGVCSTWMRRSRICGGSPARMPSWAARCSSPRRPAWWWGRWAGAGDWVGASLVWWMTSGGGGRAAFVELPVPRRLPLYERPGYARSSPPRELHDLSRTVKHHFRKSSLRW